MNFNINRYVKVKLTEHGKQILREEHSVFVQFHPTFKEQFPDFDGVPKEDSEGYCRMQMWELMDHLGTYCGINKEPPFEPVIVIEE